MVPKILFSAVVVSAVACSSSGGDTGDDPGPITQCDGTEGAPCFQERTADCSEPGDPFFIGEVKEGRNQSMRVELVTTAPQPPERFDNTWQVLITDMSGAPVEAGLVDARTWMPDHGHASPKAIVVTSMGEGVYELDPVNLFMPGLWEITVEVTPEGGSPDDVVWKFCMP